MPFPENKLRKISFTNTFGVAQSGNSNVPVKADVPMKDMIAPTDLPKLPPVPEFPMEILPDVFQPWIKDAAERARFRPDFAAVAAMAALGSLIGRRVGIRLKQHDDWTEYANVWGVLIGPPSALKSPAMNEAMGPFKSLQAIADAEYDDAMEEYKEELKTYEEWQKSNKNSNVQGPEKPKEPVRKTYWTSNATVEKLGVIASENHAGVLIVRDELSSFMTELEDERYATARGFYLSGWSGKEDYRFERIGRGTTILPAYALSIIGGIQPGPLSRYVRNAYFGDRADGLLQRFQLSVWPSSSKFEYVDRIPNTDAKKAVLELFIRVDQLPYPPAEIMPPFYRFTEEAQLLFIEWYTGFMGERRDVERNSGDSAAISAHFGKYPGLVGKLALIIHIADDPDGVAVSARTLRKALGWIEYLIPHASRIYYAVDHPETVAAELLIARMRRDELPPKFGARDIYRKGWHGLTDKESVKRACQLLCDFGWMIEMDDTKTNYPGRPREPRYIVSPLVKKEAS